MILYHPEVFLPDFYVKPTGDVLLKYTAHARRAARTDRYGMIDIESMDVLDLDEVEVVEIGVDNGAVVKYVVRGGYDNEHDIVLVLVAMMEPSRTWGTKRAVVKTVWLNKKSDTHRTLDRKRYATS